MENDNKHTHNLGPWLAQIEAEATAIGDANSANLQEISEGASAHWYLVRTLPGDEMRALRWLHRRRFGVFRPMMQRRDRRNDAKLLSGWQPVFPCWLFVFCWDMRKMEGRLLACPGVADLLRDRTRRRAMPIADDFVQRVRELSWIYSENAPHRSLPPVEATPRLTRLANRDRRKLQKLKKQLKREGRWDDKAWAAANQLAPHERISLLERALNCAPLAGGIGRHDNPKARVP